jgi:hypothetical protein
MIFCPLHAWRECQRCPFPDSGGSVVNGLFSTVTFAAQLPADAGYSAAFPIILGRHTTMWHAQPGLYACAVAARAAAQ